VVPADGTTARTASRFPPPGAITARGRRGGIRNWSPRGRQRAVLLCFLLPALAYVALFFAYPLYQDISISFQDYGFAALAVGHGPFVGFANYTAMLTSGVTIRAIVNTAVFTVGSIIFQFSIGFGMALYLQRKVMMSGVLRRVMLIPWVLPLATTGTMFSLFFATSNGLANQLLHAVGLIHADIGWLTNGVLAVAAITIANIWAGVPFNAVLLYSGLQDVPGELLEAASVDGANAWQRFTRITVPAMRQVILIVLMLGVIYTVKVFDLVIFLTNGGPANQSQLLSSWAYTQAFTAFQFGTGTAVGNILMAFTFLVGVAYLWLSKANSAAGGMR
jgi:multiple sugar transport system permease protein